MNRTRRIGTLAVSLIALLAFGLQSGAAAATPSEIRILSGLEENGSLYVFGDIKAVERCRTGRTLKLVLKTPNKSRVADRGRSGRAGAWGVQGELSPNIQSARIVMPAKKAGGKTCAKDSAPVAP